MRVNWNQRNLPTTRDDGGMLRSDHAIKIAKQPSFH